VPTSETNRVYAFDTRHITPGRSDAVRVRKNGHADFGEFEFVDGTVFGGRNYWATYRQGFPNNPWVSTGIQLNWDASGFSDNVLLDTTGDTSAGKNDSAVVVGLMVLGGVQLVMIGVLGEYIGKILSELRRVRSISLPSTA